MAAQKDILRAVGLMTGTSADGIDVAALTTDGGKINGFGPAGFYPFEAELKSELLEVMARARQQGRAVADEAETRELEARLTQMHAQAVIETMKQTSWSLKDFDVVGFHGQTILHRPDEGWTWQMGDGQALANALGLPVVFDFRGNDMAAGGQGAPLAPLYHRARLAASDWRGGWPIGVLNLGGIGNLSWVDGDGRIIAFDTGPANALLDQWAATHTALDYDEQGSLASQGHVDRDRLAQAMQNPYFSAAWPKSLDRGDFTLDFVEGLSAEDGAATLAALTVEAVASGCRHLPKPPLAIFVCGGGRKNAHIMNMLREELKFPVEPVEVLGWRGDMLEAEAFAYLAVRGLKGMPLSVPETTGVAQPLSGGTLYKPD